MPTQGIWAPWPGAQLLLALFLPFLRRGRGMALAMAKPLNLSQSSAFSPALPRFPGCGRRFHWEALPRATPHGEKWEGGSRGALCLRSPPRSKCQVTSSCRDQPSQRAAHFAAIPVVASETVCTPREPARARGASGSRAGATRAAEPAHPQPGLTRSARLPMYECIFYKD